MKCGGIDKRTGQACRFSQGHIGACASRTPLEKAQGAWGSARRARSSRRTCSTRRAVAPVGPTGPELETALLLIYAILREHRSSRLLGAPELCAGLIELRFRQQT